MIDSNKLLSNLKKTAFCLLFIALLTACNERTVEHASLDPENFTVEPATEWTKLMERNSGWVAADGIFSTALDGNDHNCDSGKKIMLWFSDTFVGTVENSVPDSNTVMVNNSIAYMDGCYPDSSNMDFLINRDDEGGPLSFFEPDNENAHEGQYYWLGDGFVNIEMDSTLYIFAYHVEMTGPNVFDFTEPNVSLIAIPKGDQPPFENAHQITTPFHIEHPEYGSGNFGAGILVNTDWAGASKPDQYVYVYACVSEDKDLLTARCRPIDFEHFENWEYWTGENWTKDMTKARASTNAVSNELSVTSMPSGEYLLTFQVMGLSEKVGCRIGQSPVGPWSDIIELYETPESKSGIFTYNAKAHPALSRPGELLISYNTITLDFWNDIKKDVSIYRPRFIRLLYNGTE